MGKEEVIHALYLPLHRHLKVHGVRKHNVSFSRAEEKDINHYKTLKEDENVFH
jgi:hypothetical protein